MKRILRPYFGVEIDRTDSLISDLWDEIDCVELRGPVATTESAEVVRSKGKLVLVEERLVDLQELISKSENLGFDPFKWVEVTDLSPWSGVRLEGPVNSRAWNLYAAICRKNIPLYTIIKGSAQKDLVLEVATARQILESVNASRRRLSDYP